MLLGGADGTLGVNVESPSESCLFCTKIPRAVIIEFLYWVIKHDPLTRRTFNINSMGSLLFLFLPPLSLPVSLWLGPTLSAAQTLDSHALWDVGLLVCAGDSWCGHGFAPYHHLFLRGPVPVSAPVVALFSPPALRTEAAGCGGN